MTMHDDIEIRLRHSFEVSPPEDGGRALDARVARAMSQPITARGWLFGGPRSLLRPLALAATLALVAGTVAATLTLLERITGESTPGVQAAWDHAELLALRETNAGVTITLERAHADLNQVAAFFTVEGLESVSSRAGDLAPLEWTAELRDPAGRSAEEWAVVRSGTEGNEIGLSANVHTWAGAVTPMAGTWELTFTSIGYNSGAFVPGECPEGSTDPACASPAPSAMIEGTWQFEFDLPEPAGSVVPTELTATEGDVTLTITELRISPTMITAATALRVDGETVTSWGTANNTLVSIEGPGGTYTANTSYHLTQDPAAQGPNGDENLFMSTEGSDEVTGSWTITVPQLWYATDNGGPDTGTIVSEPMVVTVVVP
jgi:hypothetical protein